MIWITWAAKKLYIIFCMQYNTQTSTDMATSMDQQFVEFIVKSLVDKPEGVTIERRIDEKGVLLELTVDAEDLGRVIGKRGATAQSLRTLLRALGTKNEARYNLKIVDVDRPDGGTSSTGSTSAGLDDGDDTTTTDAAESDAIARTRRELADLDDLEI